VQQVNPVDTACKGQPDLLSRLGVSARIALAPRLMDVLDESNHDLSVAHFPRDEIEFFSRTGLARDITIPNQKPPRHTQVCFRLLESGCISDYDDTGEGSVGLR
jgi:hypothetical protein